MCISLRTPYARPLFWVYKGFLVVLREGCGVIRGAGLRIFDND